MVTTVNIIAGTFGRDLKTFQEETKTPIAFKSQTEALSFADEFIRFTVPMKVKRSTYDLEKNASVYYDTVLAYKLEVICAEEYTNALIEEIKNGPEICTEE